MRTRATTVAALCTYLGVVAPPPGRRATAGLVVKCIQLRTAARLTPPAGVRSGRWLHLAAVAAAEPVAALARCVLVPALAGYEGHPSTPAKRRGILGTHAYSWGFQSGSGAKKAGKSNPSASVLLASGDGNRSRLA